MLWGVVVVSKLFFAFEPVDAIVSTQHIEECCMGAVSWCFGGARFACVLGVWSESVGPTIVHLLGNVFHFRVVVLGDQIFVIPLADLGVMVDQFKATFLPSKIKFPSLRSTIPITPEHSIER